jgi:hypothetical protein
MNGWYSDALEACGADRRTRRDLIWEYRATIETDEPRLAHTTPQRRRSGLDVTSTRLIALSLAAVQATALALMPRETDQSRAQDGRYRIVTIGGATHLEPRRRTYGLTEKPQLPGGACRTRTKTEHICRQRIASHVGMACRDPDPNPLFARARISTRPHALDLRLVYDRGLRFRTCLLSRPTSNTGCTAEHNLRT